MIKLALLKYLNLLFAYKIQKVVALLPNFAFPALWVSWQANSLAMPNH